MSEHRPDQKHMQTAYQRWELASLNKASAPAQTAAKAAEEELERLRANMARETQLARENGQREGYAAGLIEGRRDGYHEGYSQGQQQAASEQQAHLQSISATFAQLSQDFSLELLQLREQLAPQLLALAQDMAQAVLQTSLQLKPELLLASLQQALLELPEVKRPAVLRLHPDDLGLVTQACGPELHADGWRLLADPQVERGGCKLQTATHEIDANLSARWRRLQHALGQDHTWLGENP